MFWKSLLTKWRGTFRRNSVGLSWRRPRSHSLTLESLEDRTTPVSFASFIGSTANDQVGSRGVTALSNGNYLVVSPDWDNGAPAVGAVTWGDGATGVKGIVSSANSLVGSTVNDQVGSQGVTALNNGNFVAKSSDWTNGLVSFAAPVPLSSINFLDKELVGRVPGE